MSRQTEKIFKDLDKFLAEHNAETKEEAMSLFDEFMAQQNLLSPTDLTEDNAQTADDFLELAEYASTKKSALKYVKKALELDPDNIDAQVLSADISTDSVDKFMEKLCGIIETSKAKLTDEGYFDEEYIGEFWGILETRPYMRLMNRYAELLTRTMRIKAAIRQCEEMLRLCENDNLGIRYRLMHLYAYLEDEEAALALVEKYDEESTQFLLPLSILYYKQNDLKQSAKYLKKLKNVNKDTYLFFEAFTDGELETYFEEMNEFGYRPFTMEEFIIETLSNSFLITTMQEYFDWALKKLKTMK